MIAQRMSSLSFLVLALGITVPAAILAGCTGEEGGSVGQGPRGPEGPEGPAGPTGPEGPAGAEGPIGPEGAVGAVGPAGPMGPEGPMGQAGPTGPMGAMGPMGLPGSIGPAGPTGPAGPMGPIGATGPAGATGATGATGADGPAGPIGATGATGADGPAGPVGPAGATGPIGPQGPVGATGPTGALGPAGSTGPAGPPGPQGPAGPAGSGAYAEDVPAFAGFTVGTYNGNIGGRPATHAACAAQFSGAHLCHASEYLLSNSATPIAAGGAWLDGSVHPGDSLTIQGSHRFGRHTDYSCLSFTTAATGNYGTYLEPSGEVTWGSSTCQTARVLACCNGAPKILFAGFTPGSYTGNMGGRPAVHGVCGTAYPGAHMCHAAEYLRTTSAMPIPASGAWLDGSSDESGALSIQGGPSFGRHTDYSCLSFTTAATGYYGTYLEASGEITWGSSTCQTARPVACCY